MISSEKQNIGNLYISILKSKILSSNCKIKLTALETRIQNEDKDFKKFEFLIEKSRLLV